MIKDKLIFMRKHFKVTQREVARRTGIHLRTYTKYEKGEMLPGFGFLQELAEKFQVDLNWLAGQAETMTYRGDIFTRIKKVMAGLDDLDIDLLELLQDKKVSREDKALFYGRIRKELKNPEKKQEGRG